MMLDATALHRIEFDPGIPTNVEEQILLDQVAVNIRRQLPQVTPHELNHYTVALVCGGPSLNQTEGELVEAIWNGAKLVCVNGSYDWCIDHNLKPSAAVLLDGREFNARFIERAVPGCKYLLASQCHPRTFEICAGREVLIWHCVNTQAEADLISDYYFEQTLQISLGTTVGVRAISVLRTLGYQRFDIFGMDSCWLDGVGHAYAQQENNDDAVFDIWLRPQDGDHHRDDLAQHFLCSPWHAKQAEDIQNLIRERGDTFELNVRGPGLIAAMIRAGAQITIEKSLKEK